MFLYLLLALVAGWSIHVARMKNRTLQRAGEVGLLYILVGYCGLPILAVSIGSLARPDRAAAILGFPAGNPFQDFVGYALLGMSVGPSVSDSNQWSNPLKSRSSLEVKWE